MLQLRDQEMSKADKAGYYLSSSTDSLIRDAITGDAETYCNNAIFTAVSGVIVVATASLMF